MNISGRNGRKDIRAKQRSTLHPPTHPHPPTLHNGPISFFHLGRRMSNRPLQNGGQKYKIMKDYPATHKSNNPTLQPPAGGGSLLELPDVEPWPHPVDGKLLLAQLMRVLSLFVI